MGNLLTVLFSSIKSKMTSIWTKIKLWTNWNFIKSRVLIKIRTFFIKILDVKPRDRKDYYGFFGWLVSKRLAFAILVIIGVLSAFYLTVVNPLGMFMKSEDGIKSYAYNSIPLRFTTDKVMITAKSGYKAYEGNVEKGRVTGNGMLYGNGGNLVYTGEFLNSKYQGNGKLYYENENLKYEGSFQDNLYEGEGIAYQKNGSQEYAGQFMQGMKEGKGILYDSGNNMVYEGFFSKDQLLYQELLGKKTEEVAKMYKGRRTVYSDEENFIVRMEDIGALYCGDVNADSLAGGMTVNKVYVLKDNYYVGSRKYNTVAQLLKELGDASYEGNSYVTIPEAVAILSLKKGEELYGSVSMTTEKMFDDVLEITGYDSQQILYLYSFEKEGLFYTFFCKDRYGSFDFYMIEKSMENAESKE